ncbi:hypothetical protein Tco_0018639 [Tanacetum coccineum]
MNNSVIIAYRFKITPQLCFFDGSKPTNNDELQPRLSNFFKNFDSNGGDDLCYQGGLEQRIVLSSVILVLLEVRKDVFEGSYQIEVDSVQEKEKVNERKHENKGSANEVNINGVKNTDEHNNVAGSIMVWIIIRANLDSPRKSSNKFVVLQSDIRMSFQL